MNLIKWPGGKGRLLPELLRRMPARSAGRYHEPFVGGGALFFELRAAGRFPGAMARISDVNPDLVNLYRAVRDRVEDLVVCLDFEVGRKLLNTEENYYRVRSLDPAALGPVAAAARFLFLNRTCFNGLYRQDAAGRFNVPYGHRPGRAFYDAESLREASAALEETEVECEGFERVHPHVRAGDFVYLDPPYCPVSATSSHTAYVAGGFGLEDHRRLAQAALRLARRGAQVLISNSDCPAARALYHDPAFLVEEVRAPRSIAARGDRRGDVGELLVSAGHPRCAHGTATWLPCADCRY